MLVADKQNVNDAEVYEQLTLDLWGNQSETNETIVQSPPVHDVNKDITYTNADGIEGQNI